MTSVLISFQQPNRSLWKKLENEDWHMQSKEATRGLDPITVTALVLFFPIISEILRRVGLPWVVTLSNYFEFWRQKATNLSREAL